MDKNDENRYILIYQANYPIVLRYLRLKSGNTEDAKDLAQNVFVALYRHWDCVCDSDDRHIRYWLFSVAKKQIAEYYRRRERNPVTVSLSNVSDKEYIDALTYIEAFEASLPNCGQEDLSPKTKKAVAKLSKSDRELFEAVFILKTPYEQLQNKLCVSNATLRTRICRMKYRLKKILEQEGGKP